MPHRGQNQHRNQNLGAPRGRSTFTLALVVGAVVFGMVLTAGLDLVPSGFADTADPGPVRAPAASVGAMPGFADLAAAVGPAVVSIQATKIEEDDPSAGPTDPFEFFFGPRNRQRQPQRPQQREPRRADSTGSGFLISADGYIVTNHHVIEDASELTVRIGDREYPAEVKGDDPATDIALLKVESSTRFPYLEMADSDAVRVGDWLMVIGSPLRLENSVSVGVVSAKGRNINITPDASLENFIQTDAAINFGNSGGPLVDLEGRVIGIATAINFGAENIGFAVPVNTLKGILPQLRDTGSVRRGYLGVMIDDLDYEEAEAFGLDSTDGALVTGVVDDSPAEDADLRHGDVILEVDGRPVRSNRDLIQYVSAQPPGAKVKVDVVRNGERIERTITLGERPGTSETIEPEPTDETDSIEWLGIGYRDIDPAAREMHSLPEGLEGAWIVEVAPTSPLYDEQVRPGDVVVEVNGEPIDSAAAFEAEIEDADSGRYLRLYVTRVNPRSGETQSFFAIVRKP